MKFEDLTPQQKEKAIACKTPGELIELVKEEGIKLTEAQLEMKRRGGGQEDAPLTAGTPGSGKIARCT